MGNGPTNSALLLSLETLTGVHRAFCFTLQCHLNWFLLAFLSSLLLPRLLLWLHRVHALFPQEPMWLELKFNIPDNVKYLQHHPIKQHDSTFLKTYIQIRCCSCILHASIGVFYMYPYRIVLTNNIRLVSAVLCKNKNKNLIFSALSRVYGCERFDPWPNGD